MKRARQFATRVANLLTGRRQEDRLRAEIEEHIALQAEENVRAGMSATEARRQAMLKFGAVEPIKEAYRDQESIPFLENLLIDLKYGLRMLRKWPGSTVVAVLTLALGIGANTAIFSVIYGVLLRPLPYPNANRIALVYVHFSPQNMAHGPLCIADFLDWRAQNRAFEDPEAFAPGAVDLTAVERPEQIVGTRVTAGVLSTLGVQPLLGRLFRPGEDSASSPPLAVISESLWQRKFGDSPNVIGRVVELNGQPTTIVGVMPASFRFAGGMFMGSLLSSGAEIWTNLQLKPPTRRGPYFLVGIARLKPGVTMQQAQEDTSRIARNIEAANRTYSNLTMPVVSIRDVAVGSVRPALLIMFGAVLLVLLIAVVNVANLMLARATAREHEIAIRLTLGAGRSRVMRQLLTESILFSALGCAAGLLLASFAIDALRAWNPGDLPRMESVRLNLPVLGFTVMLSICAGILFGLVPALQGSRADLNAPLKEGGRSGTTNIHHNRTRAVLVVSEIALSFVLLTGAALLLRSFIHLEEVNTGIGVPPQNVLTMMVSPNAARYKTDPQTAEFYRRLLDALRALPGVQSAAIADARPPSYWSNDDTFTIAGQPWSQQGFPSSPVLDVGADYFHLLGIPLIKGRYFSEQDTEKSTPAVIINETLARHYFLLEDPLGQKIKESSPSLQGSAFMEVVGVVGDVKYRGLESEPEPQYYIPFSQNTGSSMFLFVRSPQAAGHLGPEVERAIREVDNDTTISHVETLDSVIRNAAAQPRFRTALIALFGAIALALAAIGIYGVIAYNVAQRTHEIGVRIALGAKRDDVMRLLLGQGMVLAGLGMGLGAGGALALTRVLERYLYRVQPTDPIALSSTALLLAAVAMLASYIPARRATKVDPLNALRHE